MRKDVALSELGPYALTSSRIVPHPPFPLGRLLLVVWIILAEFCHSFSGSSLQGRQTGYTNLQFTSETKQHFLSWFKTWSFLVSMTSYIKKIPCRSIRTPMGHVTVSSL